MGKLTALEVKGEACSKPGFYGDGDGLGLQVKESRSKMENAPPSKAWVFRFTLKGKARVMGLGSAETVKLSEARDRAKAARDLLAQGIDPIDHKNAPPPAPAPAAEVVTFSAAAEAYISSQRAGWSNPKHAQQWERTLRQHAHPFIGARPVADIDTAMVLAVLQQPAKDKARNPVPKKTLWTHTPETASRVRNRIEIVLDFAAVKGWRAGVNPARWKGHLEYTLPSPRDVAPVEHHPALPYAEAANFMAQLRTQTGASALALELLILCASRTGEVLGAVWSEIDRDNRLWLIPADRMKGRREHRVPLSTAALDVLTRAEALRLPHTDLIFPGPRTQRQMTDMALTMMLRDLRSGITTHGFRSTFRDWAGEESTHPNEMAELALAHRVGNAVEQAYRRGTMFAKRLEMMEDWAAWCGLPQTLAGQ